MLGGVNTVGVIGCGVVGGALARSLKEHVDVRCFDVHPSRRTHTAERVVSTDITFVCLPTPLDDDTGKLDTSCILDFFQGLFTSTLLEGSGDGYGKLELVNWVIKSTVPVSFTRMLKERYNLRSVVYNPEFLTERCADIDTLMPARHIIGGSVCQAAVNLTRLYEARHPGVPIHHCGFEEAEACKLATNAFYAVKIAFFNEVFEYCQRAGMNFETVRALMLSGGRIAHSHTSCPGPDGRHGFGGKCIPKDLFSLTAQMEEAGADPHICHAALVRNIKDRERPV